MSHIPNSAMPHAGTTEPQQEQGESATITERAGKIKDQAAELLHNHPRKTAAVGAAALAAGAIAAAAIPLVRGRSGSGGTKSGGGGRKKAAPKKS